MSGRGDLRRTLALFRRFSTGQRWMFSAAGALLTLEAATAVYQPTLLGALINFLKGHRRWSIGGFTPSPDSTIQVLAVVIVVVTAINSMADSLAEITLARGGRSIGYHLRVALFGHLQRLSLTFHLHRKAGDVLTRITSDVQALEDFVVDSVSDLAGSFLLLIGTVGWLLYKSVQVALLALVIVPVLALVSNYFASRIKAASKQLRAREGDLASTAQEMLSSISVVQIYGRGDYEQDRFARQSRSAMDAVMRTARLEAAFGFTVSVLEAGVIAAVVWIGALLIHPAISAGLLVTFILQIQNMFKPTRRIIKEWNTVGKIYASVERIGELFDRPPAVIDRPDAQVAPRFSGEIEFRDVSFAYQPEGTTLSEETPVRLALSGLSFRVAPGDVVALVGHSGAGKSTIAQLLPRLYDPHAGAVLLDGTDIRQFTIASLRSQIAMVLQETVLFSGTVADNIAYGRPDASRAQIEQAAKQAHAHDFIMALADGYDTVLGERAATLSGGQRQRLAIARGFIRDAPILILDEPTTGLDAESAQGVLAALRTLVEGRSALIVSHDFKLIRSVDRILVLSAGRILEEGTPQDLLARGGLYAELYAREFGDSGVAAVAPVPAGLPSHGEEPVESHPPAVLPFDRALTHAVPQPATAEMFRTLSGRSPGRGQRPLAERDLDPMLSPALNRALPGLAEALDAEAMARHLQRMLAAGWDLDWCAPGRVLVRPGEGVSLRYVVGLREIGTGRTAEHIVAARMFAVVEMAEQWLANQVSSLVGAVTDRPDLSPFALLAMGVWPLRMVLHAFPIDPERPGLVAATDPVGVSRIFAQALGEGPADLSVASSRYEVVRYDRDRCVLRYEILWHLGSTGRTLKQVVYGKLYSDEQGARVGPAIAAVRAHVERPGHPRPFVIPRLRGYLPELRLTLLDAVPGTAQLSSLIRSAVTDPASRSIAEAMLDSCAGIAASLHDVPSVGGPVRSLRSERDAVRADIAAIASLAPALAESLMASLAAVDEVVAEHDLVPATFGHGDLTPGQFLLDGPLVAMVDFDSACVSEPALDLGRFTSQLAVTAGKALTDAGGADVAAVRWLSQRFLHAYLYSSGAADPDELLARTAAYRHVSLIRIAVQSWRQLKLVRVVAAQRLLDQDAFLAPGADRIAGRPPRR